MLTHPLLPTFNAHLSYLSHLSCVLSFLLRITLHLASDHMCCRSCTLSLQFHFLPDSQSIPDFRISISKEKKWYWNISTCDHCSRVGVTQEEAASDFHLQRQFTVLICLTIKSKHDDSLDKRKLHVHVQIKIVKRIRWCFDHKGVLKSIQT